MLEKLKRSCQMLVWNVDFGSAIYIRSPKGYHIVINLGRSEFFSPLEHLKSLGIDKINLLILTHPHPELLMDIYNVPFLDLIPKVFVRPKTTDAFAIQKYFNADQQHLYQSFVELEDYFSTPQRLTQRYTSQAKYNGLSLRFFSNGISSAENLYNHAIATIVGFEKTKILTLAGNDADSLERLVREDERFLFAVKNCNILVTTNRGESATIQSKIIAEINPHLIIIQDGVTTDFDLKKKYGALVKAPKAVFSRNIEKSEIHPVLCTSQVGNIYLEFGAKKYGESFLNVETD